jgi:hypothetical protein
VIPAREVVHGGHAERALPIIMMRAQRSAGAAIRTRLRTLNAQARFAEVETNP